MKRIRRHHTLAQRAAVVTAACATVLASLEAQVRDIIPPLRLVPGRSDTVMVSDLFYTQRYTIQVVNHPHVNVRYDPRSTTMVLRSLDGFVGATSVRLKLADEVLDIPVIVSRPPQKAPAHLFRFVAANPSDRIIVTGTFNGWNKTENVLVDSGNTGVHRLSLEIEPGTYDYRFIVNGREILDPSNPEKNPTGFDEFNSVLRIADPNPTDLVLSVGGYQRIGSGVELTYRLDPSADGTPLRASDVFAYVDNHRIAAKDVTIRDMNVRVRLQGADLKGTKTVRVFVSRRSQTSNIQQALLVDGEPAGGSNSGRWEDGTIYSIMIDRFRDGNPANTLPVAHDSLFTQANYQGGDLRGIITTLDSGYFDSLGVNILWISPVYDNPDVAFREYPPPHRWYSGYHGYWPISDTAVEEKFGTMQDLKELIAKAHQHRIRVLLDFVAHHVHIDHPFYRQHPEWFGTLNLPDGRKNLRLWDEFRLSTWFEPYMPSFDYQRSSEAQDVMTRNAVWWLKETGADGFRHDAVKHVPNSFWRTLTRKIKEEIEVPKHSTVYQIGETFGDYDLVASYVNNGQLSAQFNFNLSYFAIPVFLESERSFSSLDNHLKRSLSAFGQYNLMGNIMDSHDKVRFMAYADGDVAQQGMDMREMAWTHPPTVDHASSYRKAEQYLAFMFTIPGLPVIYYGSEFGMTGADDPDNRRMMRFDKDLSPLEASMLKRTELIVRMRNEHSALRYGDFQTLHADRSVYAYMRSDLRERLVMVFNKDSSATTVSLHMPSTVSARTCVDVNTGDAFAVRDRVVAVPIGGIGWRVLRVVDGGPNRVR